MFCLCQTYETHTYDRHIDSLIRFTDASNAPIEALAEYVVALIGTPTFEETARFNIGMYQSIPYYIFTRNCHSYHHCLNEKRIDDFFSRNVIGFLYKSRR